MLTGTAIARIGTAAIAAIALVVIIDMVILNLIPQGTRVACMADTRVAANLIAAIQAQNPTEVAQLASVNSSGTVPAVAPSIGPSPAPAAIRYSTVAGDPRIAINGTVGTTTCPTNSVTLTAQGLSSGTYTGR